MRKMSKKGEEEKLQELRDRLYRKGTKYLWFSQFVQSGCLSFYINILQNEFYNIEDITNEIIFLKENIEDVFFFIQTFFSEKTIKTKINELLNRKPKILFIFSLKSGSFILKDIKENIKNQWSEFYRFKILEDDDTLILILRERY